MKRRIAFIGTMVLTLGIGVLIGQVGSAETNSTPGSADDPIVTKSYVDAKIASLGAGTGTGGNTNTGNTGSTGNTGTTGGSTKPIVGIDTFKVIELGRGKSLIGGEGTEIIVRSGVATAIASANGGVTDVTEGSDLASGAEVQLNHLLLTPRADGRGVKAGTSVNTTTYVMVKGTYTVK